MPQFDLTQAQLETYRTATSEPPGLDAWWRQRLADARALARPAEVRPYDPDVYGPLPVADVAFSGAGGHRIRAWYLRPPHVAHEVPLPVVVTFVGYGGGRGRPTEHTLLPAIGVAQLVMDVRGQGGGWTVGATGDPGRVGDGPEHAGVLTRGIDRPEDHYLTRLYVDAALAVDTAAALPGVDAQRIAVGGASQGGGLALAAAALSALSGRTLLACQADVPFLCDFARAVVLADSRPYREIADFLAQHDDRVDRALWTLSHVDAALLARRITAPTLVGVGLMDEICPPSTVYAAYNEILAPKEIAVYRFGVHQLPRSHEERRIRDLRRRLHGHPA